MIAIHIGLKKAGSSTLQYFLARNPQLLAAHSVVYSPVGFSSNSQELLALETRNFGKRDYQPKLLDELVHFWRSSKESVLVLSSEVFEAVPGAGIFFLREKLAKARLGEEMKIIVILRDLVDLMPSSFAQKIKFGFNTYDFDTFYARRIAEERVHYGETVSRWATAFGWENLIVRPLERQHLRNNNLVDDILHVLGIGDEANLNVPERTMTRNTRPGWRVIEAMRALHSGDHGLAGRHPILKAMKDNPEEKRLGRIAMQVGNDLKWNGDKGRYLTRDQAQECSDVYRDEVERINEHLTFKLPPAPPDLESRNFVERDFMPAAEHIPRSNLVEFYDRLAARWFAHRIEAAEHHGSAPAAQQLNAGAEP